jgi:hypothetical protein
MKRLLFLLLPLVLMMSSCKECGDSSGCSPSRLGDVTFGDKVTCSRCGKGGYCYGEPPVCLDCSLKQYTETPLELPVYLRCSHPFLTPMEPPVRLDCSLKQKCISCGKEVRFSETVAGEGMCSNCRSKKTCSRCRKKCHDTYGRLGMCSDCYFESLRVQFAALR